jgi:hypothetical protein
MHNLRRPFFPQYDMPEKYDLAREIFGCLLTNSLSALTFLTPLSLDVL